MARVPKGSAVWLGPGEFAHHEDRFETQREARRLYLEAIREENPDVLADLADEPLALFRPLLERAVDAPTKAERQALSWRLSWTEGLGWSHFANADQSRDPDAAELRALLTRWAQRWNLDSSAEDWILERALASLLKWCESPDLLERDAPTWANDPRLTTFELSRAEQAITFPAYAWNPQMESEKVARQRIGNDLRRRLNKHLAHIKAVATENGRLTETKQFKSGMAHFRWLAAHQTLKLDWPEVAERFGRRDDARVRRGALEVATLIGVTDRQWRPVGRPRIHPLHEARPKRGAGSRVVDRKRRTGATPEN